jgi:hypothetical protein
MPPVPEHRCAWRGTPMVLEVQREGVSRLRLSTHDNEYIGLLRERLAHLMGCSAKHVRMLNMGECGCRWWFCCLGGLTAAPTTCACSIWVSVVWLVEWVGRFVAAFVRA